MKAKFIVTLALALCIIRYSSAQQEIPVNMYTGTPSIFIPLHTLADHGLSQTIGLSYNVNGVNLNSGTAYGGWELEAGGRVGRKVRGLPDDYLGQGGDTRRGWLYNSNCAAVLSFPNSSNPGNCATQVDFDYLNTLNDKIDTEPDLFSFSVGGYSGQFVFDNAGVVQLIPYQNLTITPTYVSSPTDMTIQGWTITTSDGVVYSVTNKCTTVREITKTTDQQYVSLFDRLYKLYQSPVSYTSAWMLTYSQAPSGARIDYTYKTPSYGKTETVKPWNVKLFNPKGPGTTPTSAIFSLMTDKETTTSIVIDAISTSTGLKATCDPVDGINLYDEQVSLTDPYKKIAFGYTDGALTSVTESDRLSCVQLPPYTLTYTEWSGDNFNTGSQDFWGFFNGNNWSNESSLGFFPTIYVYPDEPAKDRYRLYPIPSYSGTQLTLGADSSAYVRSPNPSVITSGTLSAVTYPTGGSTHFTFEANRYYDARTGTDQVGGGLRISSVVYRDNVNPGAQIAKIFNYTESNGNSSGHLISRPSFVVPMWQQKVPTDANAGTTAHAVSYSSLSGTDPWKYLLGIVSFDIADDQDTQGSSVGYSHVTVSRPGNGKAVFDYLVPAMYGDGATGTNPTDWSPTATKYARPTTCPTISILNGVEDYAYRAFPQAEYDYERGLEWKKSEFNEAGTQVRQTLTTYQYLYRTGSTQPATVVGLSYDLFGNSENSTDKIYLYGRYSLLAGVSKVGLSTTVTTYDENNVSRYSSASTQYSYTSTAHRFLNKVSTTVADGTVYNSYMRYVPDFTPTSSTADTTSNMIYRLQQANRTSTVIEQRSSVQYPGNTEKTTGATLMKFRPFTYNKPLLRYQMVFRPATPVTDFTGASIDGSNVFHNDSRYEVAGTINEYSLYDLPVSASGEDGNTSGTLWDTTNDYRYAVASFSGARSNSIAFSDFETTTSSSFTVANLYYGTGRTGDKGIHPYATLTRTLAKPTDVNRFLLAFWAKPQSGATSITLAVKFTYNATSVTNNYTFNYNSSSNDYQYFTKVIDVSQVTTATFALELKGVSFTQPSGSGSSLLPMLDDIGFYPEHASLTSTTYVAPFGPTAVTGAAGNTLFTTYDVVGRTKLVIDQDHNIRSSTQYHLAGEVPMPVTAALSQINGTRVPGVPLTFTAKDNPCYSGTTYQWDFNDGNGFGSPSTSTTSPAHTYAATGPYFLSLKATNGASTSSVTVVVNIVSGLAPLIVTLDSPGIDGSGWATITATASESGQPVSYQWYQRPTGTTTWNTTNVRTSTFTQKILPGTSWDFKCTASTSDGRTGSQQVTLSHTAY